jgi:hypothetical protein
MVCCHGFQRKGPLGKLQVKDTNIARLAVQDEMKFNRGGGIGMKRIGVLFIGLMVLVSCASTQKSETGEATHEGKGFLYGYYGKLEPGPEGGAKLRWLKPGVNFAKYNKVMLDSVVFFFADDSEYKGMNPEELKELADGFNLALVNALKEAYPIVADPGPDVVRIRFAVTDLKESRPAMSAISSVLPIGLGISMVKKGATGSWSGSGATSAEMMALDSMTNDVIGAAQDTRTAGFTERFSKWGSADEAFKFWGERIKLFLEQAHGMKK